uniref:(California timema) hypothetical protein n=1 Tax=Timema californicum TaxID=61474 RepID=A0A7R9P2V0_TIMCA|nr:unnamed protein product [Timema californicum]
MAARVYAHSGEGKGDLILSRRKWGMSGSALEHDKETTVLSDRGKDGREQASVTRLQDADIRLAETANETEMSPSKETNTANTTNKSCSNEKPSSVNKGNAKETGSSYEQDKGSISDTVSHSGVIATALESEGAADRSSDFSKCVSSEATKLADVALAQTNDSSQIISISEKAVDGVTTNNLKIELQMVSKKKLSRNKTKNAGSKLDKIIASKLAKLSGVGRTSESTFLNTQTITTCTKTASFNRRTSLDSSFKFDPFSPVAHDLINLVKKTNTAKSISPMISDISDAEDEPASENFEEFVVNDVGALNLVKSECLDRNLRRFRSNDSSQGGSKVSKTVTNPLALPLTKVSPLPQICTQGIGITAPLCLKVDTRRRGSVGSGPSLYQKLPDNTYKNIPVEGKLGSEPLPLCLNAFSPKYSGRRSLPYVPLRRDAATQSSDLPLREDPAKTLTNCAHNRQRRHSSDFSERLAQEIIARGLCVSVPQDLKLKGDKASNGGVGCQLAPVISSDNAVHVPLSFASVEKCSARENINSGQPGDQERTTTSSFKQAQVKGESFDAGRGGCVRAHTPGSQRRGSEASDKEMMAFLLSLRGKGERCRLVRGGDSNLMPCPEVHLWMVSLPMAGGEKKARKQRAEESERPTLQEKMEFSVFFNAPRTLGDDTGLAASGLTLGELRWGSHWVSCVGDYIGRLRLRRRVDSKPEIHVRFFQCGSGGVTWWRPLCVCRDEVSHVTDKADLLGIPGQMCMNTTEHGMYDVISRPGFVWLAILI